MAIGKISLMLTCALLLASCAHVSASQQKDMENLNAVNDARQAVVEPVQGGNASKGGDGTGTPVSVTQTELTGRKQTAAENSGFRKIRLENEAYKNLYTTPISLCFFSMEVSFLFFALPS